jgi:hypothetical protein
MEARAYSRGLVAKRSTSRRSRGAKKPISKPFSHRQRGGARARGQPQKRIPVVQGYGGSARTLAETNKQQGLSWMLQRLAENSLVNREKATDIVNGRTVNIDPKDSFKKEEVLQ